MADYTVKELAELAGVTVRTLHHYDDVGLLKPAHIGVNGYRYYGEAELLRLQQVLIHRAMDIPLAEIRVLLDASDGKRLETLAGQRERLAAEAARYAELVQAIDRTIARLKGEGAMSDAELYSGMVPAQKQTEYEAWLEARFGSAVRANIEASRKAYAAMSNAERAAAMDELKALEQGLAEGLRRGIDAQSRSLEPLLARHREWVAAMWDRPCPPEAYAGLGDMYLAHSDFVARYEAIAPGFSTFLPAAMKAYAARLAEH